MPRDDEVKKEFLPFRCLGCAGDSRASTNCVTNMSADRSSAPPLDIIDAKSPANQYLVQLLEDKGSLSFQPISDERIRLIFQIWDKVSPQLGSFSRLMGLLGAELYDAIYMPSGAPDWIDGQGPRAVPYFSVVRQLRDERNEEAECLRTNVKLITATLSQKEDEIVTLRGQISALQTKNQNLQSAITTLRLEAEEGRREAERLGSEIRALDTQMEEEQQTHRQSLSDLQCQLDDCHDRIQELEDRTASYKALQQVFRSPMSRMKQNVLPAPGKVPADRTAISLTFVSSALQTSRYSYQQLLQVQSNVMDDFDAFLERRAEGSDPQQDKEAHNFLTTLQELSLELSLLRQQMESLEERLHGQVTPAGARSVDCGRRSDTESPEKTGEENIGRFLSAALRPDETLLNRYAAIIYASDDNGKIYQELPGADVCHSCAEKTLLCPHRFGGSRVIRLPQNCTHIKICRPQVHLTAVRAKIAANHTRPQVSHIHGNHTAKITQNSPDSSRSQSGAASGAQDSGRLSGLEKRIKRIHPKRESCRQISPELCVSVTQKLAAIFVLQLEAGSQLSGVQDTVWEFFKKRYVQDEISSLGLEDFLCALRRYSPESQVLCLMGLVVSCELDPSVLCYVLLYVDVIQESQLSDMDNFQHFLQHNYHFLEDAERDSLLLDFTAFSKKRVSPSRVMSFILHLILQHREPLIMECQGELSTHMKTHDGHLTVAELAEALDEMILRTDKAQIKSFIQRCVTLTGRNLISLRTAAHIAAYHLLRIQQRNKKSAEVSQPDPEPGHTGNTVKCSDLQILSNILHLTKIR